MSQVNHKISLTFQNNISTSITEDELQYSSVELCFPSFSRTHSADVLVNYYYY